ncbi:hypothetical protein GC163_18325 [bacterium]|nr:hypothetical protein [bacterium]
MKSLIHRYSPVLLKASVPVAMAFPLFLLGCEQSQEKKLLDIETPGVNIEVNKQTDGPANVDVEVKD